MSTTINRTTSYYGSNSIMGSQGTPYSVLYGGANVGGGALTGDYIGLGASSNPVGSIAVFNTAVDAMGDANLTFDFDNKYLGIGTSAPQGRLHLNDTGAGEAAIFENVWLGFAPAASAGAYDLVLGRFEDYFLDLTNWASGAAADATCFRISANNPNGKEATLVLATTNSGAEFVDITNNNYDDDKRFRWRMQAGAVGSQFKSWIVDYRNYSTAAVVEAFRVVGGATIATAGVGDVLFSQSVGSLSFVSGFGGAGWKNEKASGEYTLTVDNLVVRKELNVYELVVNKIRATNGSLWVSDSMKVFYVTGPDVGTNVYYLFIDYGGDTYIPFLANDIIRCQRWNGRGIKYYDARVLSVHTSGEWMQIDVIAGAGVPEVGDEIVRVGNTTNTDRQGSLYLTASDSGAPFMDILDGVDSASFAGKTKVRLGKLTGITDATFGGTLAGYGLYANNVYLTGAINAVSGYIGGFTIDATDGLYAGTAGTRVQMKAGVGFWAGATAFEDAPSSIANDGACHFEYGTVGGWTLDFDKIFFDSGRLGESSVGMLSGGDDIAFYVGASFTNRFTARFNVTKRGELNMRSTVNIQHQGYCEFSTLDKYFRLMQDNTYHYISLDVNAGNPIIQVTNAQTVPTWSYMQPGKLVVEEVGSASFSVETGLPYYLLMYMSLLPNTTQAAESSPNWKPLYVNINTGRIACGT